MAVERRIVPRRKFRYYMPVIDNNTRELIGYLSDISTGGFKLESLKALPINKEYSLRLDRTSEIADRPFIALVAKARWVQPDPEYPYEYFEGFQIVSIPLYEQAIYQRIVENYSISENK